MGEPEAPWQAPSLQHPLGTDEFGRDLLATTSRAMAWSLLDGVVYAAFVGIIATATAFTAVVMNNRVVAAAVAISGHVVESIPLLFWLLVIVIATPEPAWLVQLAAFTLASLPIASRIIIGEFERLTSAPYVDAARLLGISRLRFTYRHLLPNAWPVLFPLGVQLCGLAIAINGAIGVVGFGNRSKLDLGTLLLRGKEYAFTEPRLLLVGVGALALLYVFLLSFLERTEFRSFRSERVG